MSAKDEFIQAYDKYSKIYCDPVEVLFTMAMDAGLEAGHRIAAAKDLVSYRFPKQKAIDISAGEGVAGLTFIMGPQINVEKMAVLGPRLEFGNYDDQRMMLGHEELLQ